MAPAKKAAKKAAKKSAAPKKPRVAKKSAAPETDKLPEPKLEQASYKAPNKEYLQRFVKRLDSLNKTAASAAGDISTAIDAAHEQKGLDKAALSMVRRLNSMPINKLQVTLPHLLLYIEHLDLEKKASTQGQLSLEEDENDDADDMGADDGEDDGQTDIEDMARKAGQQSGPVMSIVPKPTEPSSDAA